MKPDLPGRLTRFGAFFAVSLAAFFPVGCVSFTPGANEPGVNETNKVPRYYGSLREDAYGRGRFLEPIPDVKVIGERPYHLVYLDSAGRPRTSFWITPRHPKVGRPFQKIVYRWTENGYRAGLETAKAGLKYSGLHADRLGAAYLVVLGGLPIVVSTTFGFLKGLAQGSPRLAADLKRAILSRKSIVLDYHRFAYDQRGRLIRDDVRASTGKVRLLSRREFIYSGKRAIPCRVNVINYLDSSRSRSVFSKNNCAPGDLPPGIRP